jgi:hypothetical protein
MIDVTINALHNESTDSLLPVAAELPSIDESANGAHVLWPDLVGTAASRRTSQALDDVYTHVIYYTTVTGHAPTTTTLTPMADVWSPVGAFRGPRPIDPSPAVFDPTTDTPCQFGTTGVPPCFLGDYKYGTYVDDFEEPVTNSNIFTERFFIPWSRPDFAAVPQPGRSLYTFGATLTQDGGE